MNPEPSIEVDPKTDQPEATPPPTSLLCVMWIGVFSVVAWGMAVLFRSRS